MDQETEQIPEQVQDPIVDPEYNYMKKVPGFIKYRKKANFFDTMYGIEDNVSRSSGIMITGGEKCPVNGRKKDLRIGNRYYFTSGTCGPESTPDCIGKPRNIVVNNLPGAVKDNQGLIPSVIGDFGVFEPVELMRSMAGNGSIINERCSLQNVEVTQLNPGAETYRRTQQLCVPDYGLNPQFVEEENEDEDVITENFTDMYQTVKYESYLLIGSICVLCALVAYERS